MAKLESYTFAVFFMILSIAAFSRNAFWKDEFAIWSDVVVKSPVNPRAHTSMGDVYGLRGDLSMAKDEYLNAIRLDPNYLYSYAPLAVIYGKIGELDTSIEIFLGYLKLLPDDYMARTGLGVAYVLKGRFEDAEHEFRLAIKLNPNYELAADNLKRLEKMRVKIR